MQDLGGLGPKEGLPIIYRWTLPSLMPLALPWLALLAMLAARPNRSPQIAWVVVPLLFTTGLTLCLRSGPEFIPSEVLDFFCESYHAVGFGLAAVWLLSFWLARPPRFIGFLGLVLVLGGFSVFTFIVRQDLAEMGWMPGLIVLGICAGSLALALSLAGFFCRRQYRPLRFSLWLVGWIVIVWVTIASPFFLLAAISQGVGAEEVFSFLAGMLGFAAGTFAIALPFLILSFVNPFFRERLKAMLHLPETAAPELNPAQ